MTEITVTDHAVIRYLERAHGLDIAGIRSHIATLASTGARLGASGVTVEGVKLVLIGTTVVTVLERGWHSRDLRSDGGDG